MKSLGALAGLFLLALPMAAQAADPDYKALTLSVADGQIIPGYQRFAAAARDMDGQVQAFCAQPAAPALDKLRSRYHAAMDAWQQVHHVSFGPVEAYNRGQRVEFWPDKKGTGDRQLLQVIRDAKPEAFEGQRLAFASVAVQGFPALDYLLFGEGQSDKLLAGEASGFRCVLLQAITRNLAGIGSDLAAEWQGESGYRAMIAQAGEGKSPLTDHRQAASQMFNALHAETEIIADLKLGRPLDASVEAAKPSRAESWRTKRSLQNIVLNIESMRDYYQGGGEAGFRAALVTAGKPDVAQALDAAFAQASATARGIEGGLEQAAATPDGWKRLDKLRQEVKAIGKLLGSQAAPALGLQLGFNGLDGD